MPSGAVTFRALGIQSDRGVTSWKEISQRMTDRMDLT